MKLSAAARPTHERVLGLIWGAAAGDALGWPQELRSSIVGGQKAKDTLSPQPHYRDWERYAGSRFSGKYRDPVGRGQYSDDTQLLCAVGRSLLSGDEWYERLTRVELPAWKVYQRGGGGAVLRAATAWAEGRAPWVTGKSARQRESVEQYRNAGANGVAMRIAPHVVWWTDDQDLAVNVLRDGLATHGHPRALVGALLYAGALRAALRSKETLQYGGLIESSRDALADDQWAASLLPPEWGEKRAVEAFRAAWRAALDESAEGLNIIERSLARGAMSDPEEVLRDLGCVDSPVSGAGTVTALGAIYIASRAAARPMSGLLMAAFLRKADTDTLASMTGAMLGALHGPHWLGPLSDMQDSGYLLNMGDALTEQRQVRLPAAPESLARASTNMSTLLSATDVGSASQFVDGRHFVLLEKVPLEGSNRVRAVLALEDGQIVYIDVHQANESVAQPRISEVPSGADAGFSKGAPEARTSARASTDANPTVTVQVSLLTRNLNKTGAFYARLLGREVDVLPHRRVRVADGLVFRQADGMDLQGTEESLVTLTVRDLRESARSLNAEVSFGSDGEEVRGQDPDGRWVQIVQAK